MKSSAPEQVVRRRTARGYRTRAKILQACRQVFSAEGFDKATTMQIARQAGCSEATVFAHFHSKNGLLLALMDSLFDDFHAGVVPKLEQQSGPETRLWLVVEYYAEFLSQHWSMISIMVQYGRYGTGEFRQAYDNQLRVISQLLTQPIDDLKAMGIYRQDISTSLLRNIFTGAIEHYLLAIFDSFDPLKMSTMLEQLREIVELGAKPQSLGHTEAVKPSQPSSVEQRLDNIERQLDQLIKLG